MRKLLRRILLFKLRFWAFVAGVLATVIVATLLAITASISHMAAKFAEDYSLDGGTFDVNLLPEQATPYRQWISGVGSRCTEVTPEIVAGIIQVESNWNPTANQGKQGVGLGMAQFLPSTWESFGVDGDRDGKADIFNGADAISSAENYLCYLAEAVRKHLLDGNVPNVQPPGTEKNVRDLMIVAYNKGPNIWLLETWDNREITFDANGIPDATHSDGMTGQKYLERVNDAIQQFLRPTDTNILGSGAVDASTLGGRALLEALKVVRGDPIRGSWPGGPVPYSWAGGDFDGPTYGTKQGAGTIGFDCSGLMMYIFYQASNGKMRLPHYADSQENYGTFITQGVGNVDTSDMEPGDVIFFTASGTNVAHHVAIYNGGKEVVNAFKTGTVVRVDPFSNFSRSDTWTVKRFGAS
ncbi:NlpC/P60 family protein [Yinghuangia sp. YIM S10712]|uniref:lytic transglycosylase domain-containing protein n=1 Tax=Yinghuangia sp. YIM S10712 TaxID=3436930 RepID=UPI003F53ACC4